jgi:tetrahydromethanopterin S-methyltransferase subunit F
VTGRKVANVIVTGVILAWFAGIAAAVLFTIVMVIL